MSGVDMEPYMLCKCVSDDLHSLFFGVTTGFTSVFACLPLYFPQRI